MKFVKSNNPGKRTLERIYSHSFNNILSRFSGTRKKNHTDNYYTIFNVRLHSLPYMYWHNKLILRLAGVFYLPQMTLPLNKFAHPWLRLCAKKHEWKRSIAANKVHFLQQCNQCFLWRCANAQNHQTICAVKSYLAHLQHYKTLEKHENKKLFDLNVQFVRIFIRFYTILKIHEVCNSFRTLLTQS